MSVSIKVTAHDAKGATATVMPVVILNTGATDPWINLDGRLNAPVGTPQYPTLLNTYHPSGVGDGRYYWPSTNALDGVTGNLRQPPWHVAGVDYYVGCDTTVTLQSPTTLNGAFGGAVTVSGTTVTVANTIPANSTIENIDFGVNEGVGSSYLLTINSGVTNLTIKNCKFAIGTNANDMNHNGGTNTSFINCKFNGNGVITSFNNGAGIYGNGSANSFTALYCWLLNVGGDQTDYGQNNTIKYCLYDNPRDWHVTDPHCDWLQMTDGTYNLIMQFNTVRSLSGNPPSAQGFGFYSNTAGTFVINSVDCEYNTICTTGSQPGYVFEIGVNTGTNVLSNPGGSGYLSGTATISNNYIDPTGAFAGVHAKVFIADFSNGSIHAGAVLSYNGNINMVNGATLTSTQ